MQTAEMEALATDLYGQVAAVLPSLPRTITIRRLKDDTLVLEVYADGESETGARQYRVPTWPKQPF